MKLLPTRVVAAMPSLKVTLRLKRPSFLQVPKKARYSLIPNKGPHPQGRTVYDLNPHKSGWKVILHAQTEKECKSLMQAVASLRNLMWMPASYRIILDNAIPRRISGAEAAAAYRIESPYTLAVILNEPATKPKRFSSSPVAKTDRANVEYWLNLAFHPSIRGGGLDGYYRQRGRIWWF